MPIRGAQGSTWDDWVEGTVQQQHLRERGGRDEGVIHGLLTAMMRGGSHPRRGGARGMYCAVRRVVDGGLMMDGWRGERRGEERRGGAKRSEKEERRGVGRHRPGDAMAAGGCGGRIQQPPGLHIGLVPVHQPLECSHPAVGGCDRNKQHTTIRGDSDHSFGGQSMFGAWDVVDWLLRQRTTGRQGKTISTVQTQRKAETAKAVNSPSRCETRCEIG